MDAKLKRPQLLLIPCIFTIFLLAFWTDSPLEVFRQALKHPSSSFSKSLGSFDWEGHSKILERDDVHEIDSSLKDLVQLLQDFIILEPKVPIKSACQAPALPLPAQLNCGFPGYGNGFTGILNRIPPKIGILVQFGFGVDVLEVYLNEMYDVVDRFFIIESTKSHFRTLPKGLIWEKVKDQDRFVKFADKVTHFIIDDARSAEVSNFFAKSGKLEQRAKEIWSMEALQENLRWTKFLEWNKGANFFTDDDLLGFGDADEIPARSMVHMLKHCALADSVIDVGIWFPYGNIRHAFATDFPVPDHPYTLGDPTFWTLRLAREHYDRSGEAPSRRRGYSVKYILDGMHMTHYGYLPYQLIRDITCTECRPRGIPVIEELGAKIRSGRIRRLEKEHGAPPEDLRHRIVDLRSIKDKMKETAILPWFYDCNRNRYPAWEGMHDTRLD